MTLNLRAIAEWAGAILAIIAVLGACLRWLDGRIRELIREVDLTCEKRIQEAVRAHDHDQQSHANHDNNRMVRAWMDERRAALADVASHMTAQDVVLAEIKTEVKGIVAEMARLREQYDRAAETLYQHVAQGPARGRG
jgi:uncharacterized membrane protein YccC